LVNALDPAELRAWLVELRTTLAPVSVAGYVRPLRVLGNWLAAEGLAEAGALRGLRRPRVPHKVIEPVADDLLRRLLSVCSVRDRAIVLLMLDTGLRVSEVASIRLGDLRSDGTLKVRGKGSRERMVPIGSTARQAIVRYLGQRGPGQSDDALFLGRRGEISSRGLQRAVARYSDEASTSTAAAAPASSSVMCTVPTPAPMSSSVAPSTPSLRRTLISS
jgi:integrase/recombinase XerC